MVTHWEEMIPIEDEVVYRYKEAKTEDGRNLMKNLLHIMRLIKGYEADNEAVEKAHLEQIKMKNDEIGDIESVLAIQYEAMRLEREVTTDKLMVDVKQELGQEIEKLKNSLSTAEQEKERKVEEVNRALEEKVLIQEEAINTDRKLQKEKREKITKESKNI